MRNSIATLLIVFCVLLVSCARQETGPHATVFMKDGTQYAGIVTSSSTTQVTLKGDDNTVHDLAMKDVRAIQYDDTTAASAQQPAPPPGQAPAPQSDISHEHHHHPEPAAITTRTYEVPAGTQVSVRSEETIDSATAVEGQTFAAEVTSDVRDANGDVVIPRGANTQIVIRSASKGGRFRGSSDLVLDLANVSVGGHQYRLSTVDLRQQGKSGVGANKRTAEYSGGGAALGAIIGAIAGHGKGAAIGAGSGAAGGALAQVLTRGSIKVPAETVLTFQLDQPLRVVAAT
ncbi:MAG TPA: hypothetical protein VLX58_08245 [Bryobacteraceae bacterium]|nr:hypothetical protein [Bryobacteraceae bacterium]